MVENTSDNAIASYRLLHTSEGFSTIPYAHYIKHVCSV